MVIPAKLEIPIRLRYRIGNVLCYPALIYVGAAIFTADDSADSTLVGLALIFVFGLLWFGALVALFWPNSCCLMADANGLTKITPFGQLFVPWHDVEYFMPYRLPVGFMTMDKVAMTIRKAGKSKLVVLGAFGPKAEVASEALNSYMASHR